jgi:hypothetical protein
LYRYAVNDPIKYIDPSGRAPGFNAGWVAKNAFEGANDCVSYHVGGWKGTLAAAWLAFFAEQQAGDTGLPGKINGPQDAVRHCIWSCEMASDPWLGPSGAQEVSDCHEQFGQDYGGAASEMDKANNSWGRSVSHCPGSCKDKCMDLYNGGHLSTPYYGPGY